MLRRMRRGWDSNPGSLTGPALQAGALPGYATPACFLYGMRNIFKYFLIPFLYSGVGQLGVPAGLITRRSEVQILSPLLIN